MILFCRYGVDTAAPAKGVVVAWHEEAGAPDAAAYPGTIAVPHDGTEKDFGRFGPTPTKLGDPVTVRHLSHEELDARGFPADHDLRTVAGILMTDNRREALDFRPWAAPDLTLDVARKAAVYAIGRAHDTAHDGGFASSATGAPLRYASDAAGVARLHRATMAALSGQSIDGWTAMILCTDEAGAEAPRPHTAKQVYALSRELQGLTDEVQAKRDQLLGSVAAAATPVAALAVTWA